MARPTSEIRGMFPILATPFNDDESIDYPSMKRLIDYLVDAGVDGAAILANASEAHLMSDAEKEKLAEEVIRFADGRFPVIVSITHFGSGIAAKKAAWAEKIGAAGVLTLPPFFGKWRSGPGLITEYLQRIAGAASIPIMLQDHPLTDIDLPAPVLCDMIARIPSLRYLKMEVDTSAVKVREVMRNAPSHFEGIMTGMGAIRLFWELEAGAIGCMPACVPAQPLADIIHLHWDGRRDESYELFREWLPFLDFLVRLGRRDLVKEYLHEKGVISTPLLRHPNLTAWNDWCREEYRFLLSKLEG